MPKSNEGLFSNSGLGNLDDRLTRVEEKMATKTDLFQVEARILAAIGDLATEVKNHDRRILALEKIVKP